MADGVKQKPRAPTRDRDGHPAKNRVREARAELYRQLILESAEEAFADHGYADTRMQNIATAGGLSLKTVYASFPGKADLFRAIRNERRNELLGRLKNHHREALLDERSQVMEGVGLTAQFFMAHPNFLRIQLRDGNAWALPPTGSDDSADHRWRDVMRFQTQLFARGIAAGHFHQEDPETLARMVTAMIQVKLSRWLEGGMAEDPDEIVATIQAHIARAFCTEPSGALP